MIVIARFLPYSFFGKNIFFLFTYFLYSVLHEPAPSHLVTQMLIQILSKYNLQDGKVIHNFKCFIKILNFF